MESKFYKYKSPGSLMIMGEHAVLYGKPAIVAAIDKFLEISLEINLSESSKNIKSPGRTNSGEVTIYTELDRSIEYKLSLEYLDNIEEQSNKLNKSDEYKKLIYILEVIKYFKSDLERLNYNYTFRIASEINHNYGLGSSAAVTIATLKVILMMLKSELGIDLNNTEILSIAKKIIQKIQGGGSGADLAASLYGGVIWYEADSNTVDKIAERLPLVAVYSGYKLSTKHVIKLIADAVNSDNNYYNNIFDDIEKIVILAKNHIINKQWDQLGELFNQHYVLQQKLGVSDNNLHKIINNIKHKPNIAGAKISGSGLGDCVIGLLKTEHGESNISDDVLVA